MTPLRQIADRLKSELGYFRCLIAHPKTPKLARFLLGAAVAYFISPIDIIPDVLPVLGQLDDLLIVPGLVWLALRLVPAEVITDCRAAQASSIDSSTQPG